MKTPTYQILSVSVIVLLIILSINQCSVKKEYKSKAETALADKAKVEADYLALIQSKTRIDTVYKDGKPQYVHRTDFKTITDTLYMENGKVYGLFKDSIISPDLTLHANITASDLKAIDYQYSVREKIITRENILTVHDTLTNEIRRGQLIGLADIGVHSYSAGLQYQSRKRLGFTARYNWYQSKKFVTVGVAYRIF